jgi:hypothetical protein
LYFGFGGSGGAGGGVAAVCSITGGGNSAAATGDGKSGAASADSTVAALAAGRRVVLRVAERAGFSDATGAADTGIDSPCVAGDVDVGSAGAAGSARVEVSARPLVAGPGIAGRRASACTANRSAADFVRMYPAEYTASTAAELSATRLFDTFLWGPLSDTRGNYKEGERQKEKGKSAATRRKLRGFTLPRSAGTVSASLGVRRQSCDLRYS